MRPMRGPVYGELHRAEHIAAYEIWRKRDKEPELLAPLPYCEDEEYEINDDVIAFRQVWERIEARLGKRNASMLLLHHVVGMSNEEIAKKVRLTPSRIQQIIAKSSYIAREMCEKESIS